MKILFADRVPDQLIQALYHTLIRSLGQGLVLAIVAGIIILATRKGSSRLRYNLLVTALAIFAVVSGFTFISALRVSALDPSVTAAYTATELATDRYAGTGINREDVLYRLTAFLNQQAANIVLLWFVVVLMRGLQLVIGLRSVYRLRHREVSAPSTAWIHYTEQLAAKMGIKRVVLLAESGIAKVPMVIGHLKPLILIPAGLISALPPAELEAILIHELAHISRRDYLVNLLQSLMEILFFFNPAVWWISSLIKTEREHCCDDMVIGQVSSRKEYIQALLSCEEYYLPQPAYALALGGNKNHLMNRVKRMLSSSNASLSRLEKTLLSVCLLLAILLTVTFSQHANANKKQAAAANSRITVNKPQSWLPGRSHPVMECVSTTTTTETRKENTDEPASMIDEPEKVTASAAAIQREEISGTSQEVRQAQDEAVKQQEEASRKQQEVIQAQQEDIKRQEQSRGEQQKKDPSNQIVAALIRDGIIQKDASGIAFSLSRESFTVNNVQQPEHILRKYREQYENLTHSKGNWRVNYASSSSSR